MHSSVGSERLPYKQRVGGSTPSAPTTRKGKSKQNPEVQQLRDFLFLAGTAKYGIIAPVSAFIAKPVISCCQSA